MDIDRASIVLGAGANDFGNENRVPEHEHQGPKIGLCGLGPSLDGLGPKHRTMLFGLASMEPGPSVASLVVGAQYLWLLGDPSTWLEVLGPTLMDPRLGTGDMGVGAKFPSLAIEELVPALMDLGPKIHYPSIGEGLRH